MITQVVTKVIFKIPEEEDKRKWFIENHNMSEWHKIIGFEYVSYKKTTTVSDEEGLMA